MNTTLKKRYIQIYEYVKNDIIAGIYPVGSKLPSKRVMAEDCGVSLITVEHAYELLLEEGYIISKEKSGYYVTFDAENIYGGANSSDTPHIDYVNPTPYFRVDGSYVDQALVGKFRDEELSFNIYAKTARRVLSEYGEELMLKTPGSGALILREAIASYLARSRHIYASSDRIIIGSGAEYLYGLIVQALGRNIIYAIEKPCYEKITQVYLAGGVKLERLSLGLDGIEHGALWASHAKVLHISPYRSYPSRITASAAKKREYISWSEEKDAIIVEDDVESEFTPSRKPEETLFSLDRQGRVIYVNTFTKTISPSIRIAYMVIPKELTDLFREKTGFYSCPVPAMEQYILAQLINNGDFERHINKVRRNRRREKCTTD